MQTATTEAPQLRGLTSAEVTQRIAVGAVNAVDDATSRTLPQILRANIFTLFNAILGTALILMLAVGAWRDAVFGLVLLANIAIGTAAEYRAKRVLDRFAAVASSPVSVMRDGLEQPIPVSQVVLDDVVYLIRGDQVPADAELMSSAGLEVDESMLTGEGEPVRRRRGDVVLAGSTVLAGNAMARVTSVGQDCYAYGLAAQVRKYSRVGSELQAGINRILVAVAWLTLPVALLLFWNQVRQLGGWQAATDGAWRSAAVQAVAGIVGVVPDGLVLLTSINFAVAVVLMARQRILVQELAAVEVLARVDTLCLDKTGTITDGTLQLEDVVEVSRFIGARAALAGIAAEGNSGSAAAISAGLQDVAAAEVDVLVPFSSDRKWSGHRTSAGSWVLGAPDVLLAGGKSKPVRARIADLTQDGARVLLLGRVPVNSSLSADVVPRGIRPALLVVLREQPRPAATEMVQYFAARGVDVKVISGDATATVCAVAKSALPQDEHDEEPRAGIDARALPTEAQALHETVASSQVFGRVGPERKRDIVRMLQAQGRTVAMTGDGVNDALALKEADLGIAMGHAAPATKAAARLILEDGDFAVLPSVVAQGRRIIANTERIASLFLAKSTYAVMLALVVSVLSWPYPFLPRQLALIGVLTVGIPALMLAFTANETAYRRGFLGRVVDLAVPWGLLCGTGVVLVYARLHLTVAGEQASTGATLTVIAMALWLVGIVARPLDRWRIAMVAAMVGITALVFAVPGIRSFFALQVPTMATVQLVLIVSIAGSVGTELVHRWRTRIARADLASEPDL
ncbi:MAG: HAD-IC family P-type ATPase [Beutenbergiaceae bacterium]